ncbi:hypothetical protein IQ235_07420 [Oscillatoriales cyanobacterium LEGE 11467]|uniref:Uncharacterized protein n=1 Tax=Zarconia navalis LEGE 11467 TaxID=1828826 RepID=A0A928VZN6_9CYAN|nr:hypothetical protein [Zarconia navalis]MBE9040610.1 hypothetical protein [Zarconia navalis LEGE 11467]
MGSIHGSFGCGCIGYLNILIISIARYNPIAIDATIDKYRLNPRQSRLDGFLGRSKMGIPDECRNDRIGLWH